MPDLFGTGMGKLSFKSGHTSYGHALTTIWVTSSWPRPHRVSICFWAVTAKYSKGWLVLHQRHKGVSCWHSSLYLCVMWITVSSHKTHMGCVHFFCSVKRTSSPLHKDVPGWVGLWGQECLAFLTALVTRCAVSKLCSLTLVLESILYKWITWSYWSSQNWFALKLLLGRDLLVILHSLGQCPVETKGSSCGFRLGPRPT